nr:zinc finger MYM-type protein 5-like [Hydra vulgaris]
MSGLIGLKKDSGCQVRKNAAQRTANEEKNKRTLRDCGITVTKKGEDESPTASNSSLPSQSIQVGTENDVTDISESSGEPRSKIGMVAVNEENILGLPQNPSAFPKYSNKKKVPESIFYETSLNGEKTCRDWLVWSVSKKSFICFPCSLFGSKQSFGIGHQSHLLRWNDGISCNWHKLSEKVKSHQNNAQHRNFYIEWKTTLESLENQSGIDAALENSIRNEAARWREILRCILDVTLFLASRNLSFRGSSKMIGDDNNGNFLATLELLAKHNKTLQLHLEEVSRCQQEGNKMNTHYLGWSTQNEFIKECGGIVHGAIINEAHKAIYYSILVNGTPDVSHIEQITFVLSFVYFGTDKR